MTVEVATSFEDYRITAPSVAGCKHRDGRPRQTKDHVRGERRLAADERCCVVNQEEKMAVRGPEK
jgi:hypothetical protein